MATKKTTKKTTSTKKPAVKKPVAKKTVSKKPVAKTPAKRTIAKKSTKTTSSKKPTATSTKKTNLKPVSQNKGKKIHKASVINKKEKGVNVGKVYRGKTKYIDKETKPERNYVVVLDDGKKVSVAKLKSIKILDANGKNADKALVEINATKYGLSNRTGVDFQRFNKNLMSNKSLSLTDKKVFPKAKEEFKLNSKDKHKVLVHTKAVLDPKKKNR